MLRPFHRIVLGTLTLASFAAAARADGGKASIGSLSRDAAGVLVGYYEDLFRDRDEERFKRQVQARYTDADLSRIARSGEPDARRAAVMALGVVGDFSANEAVGRALKDPDPTVRAIARAACWAIWYRAGTPEQNATLEQVKSLIARERLDEAIRLSTRLIADAPKFAEAYNQRAIAEYFAGRFAESADDCRKTIELNPYHFGALGGLSGCCLQLGKRQEAVEAMRKHLKIEPHDDEIRERIERLEAESE